MVIGASNTTATNVTVENITQFKAIMIILDVAGGGVYATACAPMSFFLLYSRSGTPLRAFFTNSNGENKSASAYYVDDTTIAVSVSAGHRAFVYGVI